MFRIMSILLAIALLAGAGWYFLYRDTTQPPHFSTEDMADKALSTNLQNIAEATVAGGAPAVILGVQIGEDVTIIAAGVESKRGAAAQPDARLRIASISKLYTAAIVLILADEGAIDLDVPISKYLSQSVLDAVPNADQATVRQLLNHTSGIPDYYTVRGYLFDDWTTPITLDRMLPYTKRGQATGQPGERFSYSNMGYVLLGEIAERVTGKGLGELLEERIFQPLTLDETTYNIQHPEGHLLHGYGTPLRPWADTYQYWEHSGPDAGVMASASDTLAFLNSLTDENGQFAAVGDTMLSSTIESGSRQIQGLGLQVRQTRSGTRLIGHSGDVFGYQTLAYALPERNAILLAHVTCDCTALLSSVMSNSLRALDAHTRQKETN